MAKNRRIKPEPAPVDLATWEEADEALRQIGDLKAQIDTLEAEAKGRIDRIQEDLQFRSNPMLLEIHNLTRELEAFAESRRGEFRGKSRTLAFGKLGWRSSTRTKAGARTLELIKQHLGRKLKALVKVEEKVVVAGLKKLTPEELELIEATQETTETFFVEPKAAEAIDYQEKQPA